MSDRELFKDMLARAGVVFEEKDHDILVKSDGGSKNDGWGGFYTVFAFDTDGSLGSVGVRA